MNAILLKDNGDIQTVQLSDLTPIKDSLCSQIGNGCGTLAILRVTDARDLSFPVSLVSDPDGKFLCGSLNLTAAVLTGQDVYGNALLVAHDSRFCRMTDEQVSEMQEFLRSIVRSAA